LTRLLVGSDFHGGRLVGRFEERLGEDVVPVFCGDLVNRPRDDAPFWRETVARWARLNPDLVVVPGNHDPEEDGPWEGVRVHERRGLVILAIPYVPILYKIPSWTHEISEARIAEHVAPFAGRAYDVVASHGPPYGVVDRAAWGRSLGSRALLEFADHIDFRLWVCGHVHEESGAAATVRGRPIRNAARTILDLEIAASTAFDAERAAG
jgi:Icc-related predicted phosphoesterase